MHYFREFRRGALAGALLAASAATLAQTVASAPNPLVEQLRQQERERALRGQQERGIDARLPRAAPAQNTRLPDEESPCFRIDRLVLAGERAGDFQWTLSSAAGAQGDDSPLGRCLGTQGVDIVLSRLQQAVIARGYVTTRILAPAQELSGGTLTLTLVPGRIAAIRLTPDSSAHARLFNAIPARAGDLLNLRDIEQGLENLQRVPTAAADIRIEPSSFPSASSSAAGAPGAQPGDSDLVVKYQQSKRWRAALSLDDSGTEATGRYQGGITLSADNPLGLNDLFYASANHSLATRGVRGTEGQSLHYSVPWGYWLLGAAASKSRYHQSVAGAFQSYDYAGKSENAELKLARLVYRDQNRKTTLALRAFRHASRNFIDDTEVEVQRRVVGGWEASVNHKEFIALPAGQATLEASLAYRRGTGAFGSIPAPEQAFGEGEAHFKLIAADLALNLPFQLGDQKLRYSGLWRAQWNRSALTPQQRFGIGGRYSVRGFDGEASLMGERGWFIRNDIGYAMGASGAELYAGADYGQVGGPSARQLLGRRLAGAVIGLRGAWKGLAYDLFVGKPIAKPEGFRTARVTAGFSLIHSF